MRILLLAHACGPNRGSEPGTAWNLAWELSAEHEVWVLMHPQYAVDVDAYLVAHPRPLFHVDYVNVNPRLDPWNPKHGERRLKLHYILWQYAAARRARELCDASRFDVAHHVTLGTINAPPVMHKLPVPVVWGPLGGGQTAPMAFKEYFRGHVMAERARHVMAAMLPFSPSLRRMAKKSSLSLAKNMETLKLLQRAGSRKCQFLLDCGLPAGYVRENARHAPPTGENGTIELLWAGRLEQRKAPRLAVEAMAQASDANVRLTLVGEGPAQAEAEEVSRQLGQQHRVRFLGKVPYEQMNELFQKSHALLFTSLRDSTGCVVLEAMGHGLPVIILNHQGVACFVPDAAGLKVPVTTPPETIRATADAIRRIATDAPLRERMSHACLEAARRETWDQRAKLIAGWYAELAR